MSHSPHLVETQRSEISHLLPLQFGRPLHQLLRLVGGLGDGGDIAVSLDPEADDGLSGLGNSVDDDAGPAILDTDDHDRRDIGVRSGADQGAEMEFEIFAELQPAIGMRDRHRALDVVGHRFANGVRQIVKRKDQDIIAHAHAAILTPPALKGSTLEVRRGARRRQRAGGQLIGSAADER